MCRVNSFALSLKCLFWHLVEGEDQLVLSVQFINSPPCVFPIYTKLFHFLCDLSIGQNVANNYLMLFISAQNAFVYESNLTKNHSNVSPKLSPAEQHLCQQFYELISQIKADSIEHYKAVCSFIRFPYQVISNSLGSLSLGNDMKYVTF